MADGNARAHHAGDDNQCRDGRRAAAVDKFLETEFKPEREQQDYDTDLGPEIDIFFGSDRGEVFKVGACEKAGHDVSEHYGLLDPFEKNSDTGAEEEDKGKVGDESFYIHMSESGLISE